MKKLLTLLFMAGPVWAGTHTMEGTPFVAGQCVQAAAGDTLVTTGGACGGSGSSPGGNNTDVQFNQSGVFMGTDTFTWNGTTMAVTGAVTATSATIANTLKFAGNTLPNTTQSGNQQVLYFTNGVASFGDAPGFSMVDNTLYTVLVTSFNPVGGVYNDGFSVLSTSAAAAFRMTPNRAEHVNLRDNNGVAIGTGTASPLYIYVTNPTTSTISGNVTVLLSTVQVINSTVGVVQAAGAFNVVSTNTVLGAGVAEIGNVKNSGTFAVQATQAGTWTNNISTSNVKISDGVDIASVTAAGAIMVDGSATTQPISGIVTSNQGTAGAQAWPVTSTYTVISATYTISVAGTFTPPAITTVSWANQGAQNVVSTSVVVLGSTVGVNSILNPVVVTGSTVGVVQVTSPWATKITDNVGVILGTATTNPIYTYTTNPATAPINVSISSGAGPSGTVLTLSGRITPQTTGTIKNSTDTISVFVSSFSNVTFMITPGTSTGITANFETSIDSGTNWVSVICNRVTTFNTESSFALNTTTNIWTCSVMGASNFRVRSSAWTAGIATVTMQVTGDPVSQSISVGQPTASQLQTSASINGSSNTVSFGSIGQPVTSTSTIVVQSTVGAVQVGAFTIANSTFQIIQTTVGVNSILNPVVVTGSTVGVNSILNPVVVTGSTVGVQSIISALPSGTNSIGTVVQSTAAVAGSTIAVVNAVGQSLSVTGTFAPPAITTVSWANQGAQAVTSTSVVVLGSTVGVNSILTALPTGTNSIGTVVQSTAAVSGSTIAVVNAVGTTMAVSGTLAVTLPAVTTTTFNSFGQPVTSTFTVIVASNIYNNTLTPAATGLIQLSADSNQRLLVTGIPIGQVRQATATLTTNTETVFISSGAANVFDHICGCVFSNTSGTGVRVDMRGQGGNGNINMNFYLPAADTRGFWPGCQNPFAQLNSASQWSLQLSASVTDVRATCQYIPSK